jgi:rSAM/selenodomain-associated transferase 2
MRLSVIVPAYREGVEEARCLQQLVRHPRVFEIIVSAFDCSLVFNRTLKKIPKLKLIRAPGKGRGDQMNFGAEVAKGDFLLFLHADSRLEKGGLEELIETMESSPFIGGVFRLKFRNSAWKYRLKAWGANLRSKSLGMPYGDQGFFVQKTVFKRLRGFQNWPLFEDVDFFDRLKKEGSWVLLNSAIITSTRRWEKQGYWKATLKNALWILLYRLGISVIWLTKHY